LRSGPDGSPGCCRGAPSRFWVSHHPSMGDPPLEIAACFRGRHSACVGHQNIRICSCSHDSGTSLSFYYKLALPSRYENIAPFSYGYGLYSGTDVPLPPPPPPPLPPINPPASPPPRPPAVPVEFCHPLCPNILSASTIALREAWRSVDEGGGTNTDSEFGDIDTANWYYFVSPAGNRMPVTPPPDRNRCGSISPGYLATPHPARGEPPTDGTVCFKQADDCSIQVQVSLCTCSFDPDGISLVWLYKLPRPPTTSFTATYCATNFTSS